MDDRAVDKIKISKTRKLYIARLVSRCLILIASVAIYFRAPAQLEILEGWNFFERFSSLHLLWAVWVIGMFCQLIPIGKNVPLGSQKLFRLHLSPGNGAINYKALHDHIVATTKSAYKVFILWGMMIAVMGVLHRFGILTDIMLFLATSLFYVCDLICVLVWCPFRLIMKNRCCTTCRIFNWDHLMMFSPMLFVNGFFSRSLLVMAVAVWLVWELCVMMYPERFWDTTNEALRCSKCTDKLCTQYCPKPTKK